VTQTATEMVRKARENAHRFVWDRIKSPEHMAELRLAATEIFLADYDIGRTQGRYVDERLPELPFATGQFDLAVCSHFLFLYRHELSLDFHLAAVNEMCRVAKEARIFPLLGMAGEPSDFVEPVMRELGNRGLYVTIEKVDYEFQRGGNQMMRIKSSGAQ
jgi:SAM-dependent methyltransferase